MSESRSMTLWDLEQTLVGLMQIVSDPEATEEERTIAGEELQKYVEQEVRKVDGIRAYLRHCDLMVKAAADEAKRQADHARIWKNRAERLEQMCLDVMQYAGVKKLEGKTGSISVRSNGGQQPLTITDESLIPGECKYVTPRLTLSQWSIAAAALGTSAPFDGRCVVVQTDNGLVRRVIEKDGGVPGARLEPRGVHLRVE